MGIDLGLKHFQLQIPLLLLHLQALRHQGVDLLRHVVDHLAHGADLVLPLDVRVPGEIPGGHVSDVPHQPVDGLFDLVGDQHGQDKPENQAGRKHDNHGLDDHDPIVFQAVQGDGLVDHDSAALVFFKGHQAVFAVQPHLQKPLVLSGLLQFANHPVIFRPVILRLVEGGDPFAAVRHHHRLLAPGGISQHVLKQVRGQAQHHPASRIRPAPGQRSGDGKHLPLVLEKGRLHQIQLIAVHGLVQLPVEPAAFQNPPGVVRAAKGRSRLHHAALVVKHGQLHNIIPIFRDRAIILDQLRVIQPLLPGPRRQSSSNFSQVKGLALRAVEDNIDHLLIGQMVPVGDALHVMLQRILRHLQRLPAGRNIAAHADKNGDDADYKEVVADQPRPQRLPPNQFSHTNFPLAL